MSNSQPASRKVCPNCSRLPTDQSRSYCEFCGTRLTAAVLLTENKSRSSHAKGSRTVIVTALVVLIAILAPVSTKTIPLQLPLPVNTVTETATTSVLVTFSAPNDQLILQVYNWASVGALELKLQNVGSTTINLATANFYVGGAQQRGAVVTCSKATDTAVTPGTTCTVAISVSEAVKAGVSYVLKIGLDDGAVLVYSAIAGAAQ